MLITMRKSDGWLALMVFGLVLFGIIMIYSASVIKAHISYGDDQYFVKRQLVAAIIGFAAMVLLTNIDYHFWQKSAGWMLTLTYVLMLSVFVLSVGARNGAHRWIAVGGQTFQPSELAKLSLIVYISAWLAQRKEKLASIGETFVPYLVILASISAFMLAQKDLGTLSIILASVIAIYFVAGLTWKQVLLGVGVTILGIGIALAVAPYRVNRIKTFLNPTEDASGTDYHSQQIAIAIGSGGWFGLGFGNSRQKRLFLPEPHTDSIFAIMTEELGALRSTLIVVVFYAFILRAYRVAMHAKDDFGRYLAVGIGTWFGFQAFINLASMLRVVPLVGVPLPFISYGGTSILISLAAVGVLLSVSRQATLPQHQTEAGRGGGRGRKR